MGGGGGGAHFLKVPDASQKYNILLCVHTHRFESHNYKHADTRGWSHKPETAFTGIMNGACAHYVMVSKFQWTPFWLATQRDPQNDWTATPNRANYDVFAQAPSGFR